MIYMRWARDVLQDCSNKMWYKIVQSSAFMQSLRRSATSRLPRSLNHLSKQSCSCPTVCPADGANLVTWRRSAIARKGGAEPRAVGAAGRTKHYIRNTQMCKKQDLQYTRLSTYVWWTCVQYIDLQDYQDGWESRLHVIQDYQDGCEARLHDREPLEMFGWL